MTQHGKTRIYVLEVELKIDVSKTVKEWKYLGAKGEKLKGGVEIWIKRAFEENNFEISSIAVYYCNQIVS